MATKNSNYKLFPACIRLYVPFHTTLDCAGPVLAFWSSLPNSHVLLLEPFDMIALSYGKKLRQKSVLFAQVRDREKSSHVSAIQIIHVIITEWPYRCQMKIHYCWNIHGAVVNSTVCFCCWCFFVCFVCGSWYLLLFPFSWNSQVVILMFW